MKESAMSKEELTHLYNAYVSPGMRQWKRFHKAATDDLAFLMYATDLVLDDLSLTQDEILDACRYDGKWDLKVDSGFVDEEGKTLYLIQAKHWNATKSIGLEPFTETWEALEYLGNQKLMQKGNTHTKDFYVQFCDAVKRGFEIALFLVTSGRILQTQRDYVNGKPKSRDVQVGDASYSVSVRFQALGLPELVGIERKTESHGEYKDVLVTLDLKQGWYCVPEEAEGRELYESLYTTVEAEEIVKVRQQQGPNVYRLNYRGPLGNIAVNREILDTVTNIPETFHVLNNGVAAICDHFSIDEAQKKVTIKGLQIVNGCQTVETLYNNPDKVMGKTNPKVNLRLVVCQRSQAALVARATNNQTKLRADDFATLERIHEELQSEFSRLEPPWYYEIKRSYWKNVESKDKVERHRYSDENGTPRLIKLKDAAQRSFAFMGEPIRAGQNTSNIFRKEADGGYEEVVFPDKLRAYQILLPWKIYELNSAQIEHFISEVADTEPDDKVWVVDWIEYGRLTTVALVGDALRNNYKFKERLYIDNDKSKALVDSIDKWLPAIAQLALKAIWYVSKSNEGWVKIGPRATFRKLQTYQTIRASFMPSYEMTKSEVVSRLP